MEVLATCVVIVASITNFAEAVVKCHDCTSWNPYCQETVNKPFESAVAVVECEITSTCFLKQDANGVLHRGCADGWLGSRVDLTQTGCSRQRVPWMGEMLWCFCKQDFCNGGSVTSLDNQTVSPQVKEPSHSDPPQDVQLIDHGGLKAEEKEEAVEEFWEEEQTKKPLPQEVQKPNKKPSQAKNDDVIPERVIAKRYRKRKGSDGKYELWYWHANSDRPVRARKWSDGKETWRAPKWVERSDGKGWDFPVMGPVHQHSADHSEIPLQEVEVEEEENAIGQDTASSPASSSSSSSSSSTSKDDHGGSYTWHWGRGWGHIRPWWLGRKKQQAVEQSNEPVYPDIDQDDDSLLTEDKVTHTESDLNDVDTTHNVSTPSVILDVEVPEFFCWDCYSKSPLCGETVDTQMANHLGKTPCSITRKCFVRKEGDLIYRGCADGWMNSRVDMDYVGCRVQAVWGQEVEWCFCTASLCNGDSRAHLEHKYSARVQPFKAKLMAAVAAAASIHNASAMAARYSNRSRVLPEARAPGQSSNLTLRTPHNSPASLTPDFHTWNDSRSALRRPDSRNSNEEGGETLASWRAAVKTGSDASGNDDNASRGGYELGVAMAEEGDDVDRANYEARGG